MRFRWNSLIVKLILVFFAVITPLYALSVTVTNESAGQMREEIESSNESVLLFHQGTLQFEFNRMSNLLSEYSVESDLSDFHTMAPVMSQYQIAARLNNILTKLRRMQSSSPYIEDVIYHLPSLEKVVSIRNGVQDARPGQWKPLIEHQGNLQGAIFELDGNLYMLRSSPTIFTVSSEPNFILAIQLSTGQLVRQLETVRGIDSGGAFLSFGGGRKVISEGREIPDEWIAMLNAEESESKGSIQRLASDDYHLYAIHDQEYPYEFVSYISNDVFFEAIDRYKHWMWILTILSSFIVVLFSYWLYRVIHRPLAKLIRGFRSLERGDTTKPIEHRQGDEFGYLYDQYNRTIDQLHTLIEDNYVQRIRSQETQLKHLQSQITPHFLYNSLFTIKQMAEIEDVDGIKRFSEFLGRYFRFMTRDFAMEVTLKQEIEHALVYLEIQKIRFSQRITVEIESLAPRHESIMVPRIIIQPILENVFEHGLHNIPGGGILRMSYRETESMLAVVIEDNGNEVPEEVLSQLKDKLAKTDSLYEVGETTGLLNIHHRLRIHFGEGYGLQLSRSDLGGLQVEVRLPRSDTNT